ncbi:MAG: T9SS type A sorting domain-containing protein [Flavobacteriales bacterium]|nr:T9SS type A sorting domain-containing protein [Flavobacteriales bacterium]
MRTDNDLSPLWARRFLHSGGFQFVKELPGGDLLAGANMETAGTVIVRFDPEGNVVWSKSYFRPSGRLQDALVESDDSFVITGYTDSTLYNFTEPLPPSFQPKLFMLKLNGEGEIQWCKGYDSAPFYWHTPLWGRIARTQDGNYAVTATLGMPGYALFYRPFLMKTDLNGDTLWTSTTGYAGMALAAFDLCAHASGNFYLSGLIWGNLPNGNSGMVYVFKADENGGFSCGQEHHTIEVLDLFPADSAVVLNSLAGITEMPALLNDTTFAPVTEYNGCTFATKMPPRLERRTPMFIRPNPNTGHFTLSFADPLMAESYYSVYDTVGKLLFQRPLPQGKSTEEVDLTRFGAGTYVVRFTSKEGSCYERVLCSP